MPGMTRSGGQPGPKIFVQMGELSSGRGALEAAEVCSSCRIQSGGHINQANQFQSICWSTIRATSLSWTKRSSSRIWDQFTEAWLADVLHFST